MRLEQIEISNFRSLKKEKLSIKRVNNSSTYCLLGINEAGKSSFLMGVSLIDGDTGDVHFPQDYFDDSKPVKISLTYNVTLEDQARLHDELKTKFDFPHEIIQHIVVSKVVIDISYSPSEEAKKQINEVITFKKPNLKGFKLVENKPEKMEKNDGQDLELSLNEFFSENLPDYFWSVAHKVTFWESRNEYLISDEVDLTIFSANPEESSIPLTNCFLLSGFKLDEITKEISKLNNNPAPIRNLESKLSENVTRHINKLWPGHPISIKFKINNNKISLLIEDNGVKHKAKTIEQRSDGFRQFISFLLTLSAENLNEELTNTILLIDEPEIHLHPQAQINLKDELIKITTNDNNNIVIYATHSNYMIDKKHLDRNIQVVKSENETTKLQPIAKSSSSYSEVNYTIFKIPTSDYHNELYGYLEYTAPAKLKGIIRDKKWINEKYKTTDDVSLSMYIRNAIHHPENTKNKPYTEASLKKSIDLLRKLKYDKS